MITKLVASFLNIALIDSTKVVFPELFETVR